LFFLNKENKLSNLTCLNLAENRLTTVNFSWFAGATNLNSLNLDSNLITNLETPGADLSFFSNLRYLYLSNNCIKSLPKMRLPMLKLLAADGNEIEELEPDFFGALPEINHVNFERNKLSFSITAQTFSACNHLLCLQFAFNKRVEIIVTVDVEEQQTVVARDGVAPFFSQFIEYLSIDVPLSSFFSRTSGTTTVCVLIILFV
jgi:Leucine-rich repeat (LRR) protein